MKTVVPSRLRAATLATCFAGLFAAPALQAQDAFRRALPEKTLVYVSAPDFEHWYTGFQSSAIYKIWLEEEVQEFLADLLDEAKKQYSQVMARAKSQHEAGKFPVDPAKLEQLRIKSFSLAVTDLVMPGQQPAKASILLSLDFGDSSKIVSEMLESLVPMVLEDAPEGAIATRVEEVEGVKLKVITSPMAAAMMPSFGITYGVVDGKLVLGTDVAATRTLVASLKGKAPEKSLADDAQYQLVSKRVSARSGEVEFFMRPKAMLDFGIQALRFAAMQNPRIPEKIDIDGVERAIDVLGLNGFKAVGMSSGYDGGKGVTRSFAMIPEDERRGLFALADSSAHIDLAHLAWIPKDVSGFAIARMGDLKKLYTTLMDAVNAYDPGVGEQVAAQISELEQSLGFKIKDDAFGAFGEEFLSYSMPVSGLMATPEMVFMLGCQDSKKTLDVLKKLCGLSEGIVAISEVAGEASLYSVDLTLDEFGGGMDPTGMLDPTIGFKNGRFIFALSRGDVKTAMARFAGDNNDGDVRQNEAFKPYLAQIPQKADSLSFTVVASAVDGVYTSISGIVGMLPIPPDIPVDVGLLPSTESITKHLFGSVSWGNTIPQGYVGENIGPFGPELFVGAVAIGVGAGVAGALFGGRGRRMGRRR